MKLRTVIIYLGLVALLILVAVNFGKIREVLQILANANWYILPVVVAVQAVSYLCNAKYYQSFFALFQAKVPLKPLYEVSLGINFVNQAFPSGGISGSSYMSSALSGYLPVGKSLLAQIFRYIFTFLSYLAVLVAGFLAIFFSGAGGAIAARVTLLVMLAIIVASLIIIFTISDRRKIEWLGGRVQRIFNKVAARLKRKRRLSDARIGEFYDEFYHGYDMMMDRKYQWRRPLWWALAGNLAEIATVYAVFAVLAGDLINPGIVIAGYTLANIVSLAGFVTGGVGVYEATMITTFAAFGLPLAISLTVVLVYRTLNFMIFLPVGFYYYRKTV